MEYSVFVPGGIFKAAEFMLPAVWGIFPGSSSTLLIVNLQCFTLFFHTGLAQRSVLIIGYTGFSVMLRVITSNASQPKKVSDLFISVISRL